MADSNAHEANSTIGTNDCKLSFVASFRNLIISRAQDLLDELVPAWKAVFQERLPQQLNWYTQEAQRIFGDLCKSVIASAEERFPRIAEPLNLFRDKIPQLQEDIVSYAKDAYDEDISGYAKDVWRLVSPAIRETMVSS